MKDRSSRNNLRRLFELTAVGSAIFALLVIPCYLIFITLIFTGSPGSSDAAGVLFVAFVSMATLTAFVSLISGLSVWSQDGLYAPGLLVLSLLVFVGAGLVVIALLLGKIA